MAGAGFLTLESVALLGSVVPLVSVGWVHGVMCWTVPDGEMISVAQCHVRVFAPGSEMQAKQKRVARLHADH